MKLARLPNTVTGALVKVALAGLLAGCAIPSGPPLPKSRPVKVPDAMKFFLPASPHWAIAWNYATPVPSNIVFDVYCSPVLPAQTWELFGTTTNLIMPFPTTNAANFFRVKARDTVTGISSDWNHL